MAGCGLDGFDHGNTENELKTSTYEKRAKVWSWLILVWMGRIINAHLDLGFWHFRYSDQWILQYDIYRITNRPGQESWRLCAICDT